MSKPKKAKKLKFICAEGTSSYRSQKLSCLRFEELPNELIIGTLSYLNMKDLINCSQVSKRFRAIVVDEQGRRKEDLLKIIQDLQCFKCKKVPRPYGNQSKRYLCGKSHSLCVRHKKYKVEDRFFWLYRFSIYVLKTHISSSKWTSSKTSKSSVRTDFQLLYQHNAQCTL